MAQGAEHWEPQADPRPPLAARPATSPVPAALCLLLMPAGLAAMALQDPVSHRAMLQEGGALETASAGLYLVGAGLLTRAGLRVWPFTVILLACALRELDLDKLLFTEGLLKSRQYLGDTVGALERSLSALVLIGLLASGLMALRQGLHGLRRRIAETDGVTLCVLLALMLLVTAKEADALGRHLREWGITMSSTLDLHVLAYEEFGEAVGALCLLLAATTFVSALKKARAVRPAASGLQ